VLDYLFKSVIDSSIDASSFLICTIASILLGLLIAIGYMYKNTYTKSFVTTLALLPVIVQVVIMMANGNLGVGVAVAGAFSLVRFRSAPGTAKEICIVFLSMAVGLATGMGYVGVAALAAIVVILLSILYSKIDFGNSIKKKKLLKVTIPESLDYNNIFDDLFEKYTDKSELIKVKTSNMGSLYQIEYLIEMKNENNMKEMIDTMRCRNGNLDIVCSRFEYNNEEL
jgi:uncharacterized membrane protein YhiD involved in acid resistance